jgi:hypothetical protein
VNTASLTSGTYPPSMQQATNYSYVIVLLAAHAKFLSAPEPHPPTVRPNLTIHCMYCCCTSWRLSARELLQNHRNTNPYCRKGRHMAKMHPGQLCASHHAAGYMGILTAAVTTMLGSPHSVPYGPTEASHPSDALTSTLDTRHKLETLTLNMHMLLLA